jgi:CarD family transcriptional regulator
MFTQGQKAFYPTHGVGVIEKIEKISTSNQTEHYYVIRILDSGMTVTVPLSKAKEVGLRPLIGQDMVEKVFNKLRETPDTKYLRNSTISWNRRQRVYMAKLKTGEIFDIVEVFKELSTLKKHKTLSFGEKKLYEQVKKLLVKELAYCKNCSEADICSEIESLLSS